MWAKPWGWSKMYEKEDRDDRILLEQVRLGKIAKIKEKFRKNRAVRSKKLSGEPNKEGFLSIEELWSLDGY